MPDLTELYLKSLEKPDDLSLAERFRLERLFSFISSNFKSALEHHKSLHHSKDMIEKYVYGIRPFLEQPVFADGQEKERRFHL